MIILIDINNEEIKWSLYNDQEILIQKPIPYAVNYFQNGINRLLAIWSSKNITPRRILVCSSAPLEVSQALDESLNQIFDLEVENLVASRSYKDLKNSYHKADCLDINRWLKLIGAYESYSESQTLGAYCVIDCSSSIVVDAVDQSGKHLGGFITPGIELMEESLLSKHPLWAAQTGEKSLINKMNKLKKPSNASALLANNTKHAVVGGIFYAVVSYLENIIADLDLIFNSEFNVFITGANAMQLLPMLNSSYYENLKTLEVKQDLVWQGMISLIDSPTVAA